MEIQQYLFILSVGVLAMTSSTFGIAFLVKGNCLLGVEWLVIAFSSASILVYALGDVDAAYTAACFCDALLRGCGPVIMILGLMAVTHDYNPLRYLDIYLFGGAMAATAALMACDAAAGLMPAFYLCMWSVLSLYLAYFVWRLLKMRTYGHAFAVGLVLAAAQAVAVIYDFYTLPGDDEHLGFYLLAAPVWSFMCAEMYYAYCALERRRIDCPDDNLSRHRGEHATQT